jgi:hypothetical protein
MCLGAATLVTLLNPYGIEYWWYLLDAVTMERPGITEWNRLSVLAPHGFYAMAVTAVFLLGSMRVEKRVPPEAWALAATTLVAAFSAQRMLNLFYPVLAVYGGPSAAAFAGMLRSKAPGHAAALRRVLAAGVPLAALLLVGKVARNLGQVAEEGLSYEAFPVGAVEWLETRGEGGRLLLHFNHGSFGLWRLYPEYLVSVDGRYEEVYPQSTVDLSFKAIDPREPGHEAALRELNPDYILVPVASWVSGFAPPWTTVYDDGRFAVLSRRSEHSGGGPVRPMWSPGF